MDNKTKEFLEKLGNKGLNTEDMEEKVPFEMLEVEEIELEDIDNEEEIWDNEDNDYEEDDTDSFEELEWDLTEFSEVDTEEEIVYDSIEEEGGSLWGEEDTEGILEEDIIGNEEDTILDIIEEDELDFVPNVSLTEDIDRVTDIDEEDIFSGCVYEKGMSIDEFLRENPDKRTSVYLEHFFSDKEIEDALKKGTILVKRGVYKI